MPGPKDGCQSGLSSSAVSTQPKSQPGPSPRRVNRHQRSSSTLPPSLAQNHRRTASNPPVSLSAGGPRKWGAVKNRLLSQQPPPGSSKPPSDADTPEEKAAAVLARMGWSRAKAQPIVSKKETTSNVKLSPEEALYRQEEFKVLLRGFLKKKKSGMSSSYQKRYALSSHVFEFTLRFS